MKPTAAISEITFFNGNTFQIQENEKVILVGPNNSGKSQFLRELLHICGSGKTVHKLIIRDLKISKKGTVDDLKKFLDNKAKYYNVNDQYRYKNWQMHKRNLYLWDQDYLTGGLLSGFVKSVTANNRLSISEQQQSIATDDLKTKPQHVLYDDDSLMSKISELFKQAFGKELMINFRGGSKIPIHVGELPSIPSIQGSIDRVGDAYVQALKEQPLLNQQGDGMKSYAGILFEAIVSDLDITLIDEPEAFLHPPQMKKLGETLASKVNGQLFIATHSSDILRGFLEGAKGNIQILRISREGNSNIVMKAPVNTIKNLWKKPNLRYSNALECAYPQS